MLERGPHTALLSNAPFWADPEGEAADDRLRDRVPLDREFIGVCQVRPAAAQILAAPAPDASGRTSRAANTRRG